jgi:predicted amidohydrolase YtcJ
VRILSYASGIDNLLAIAGQRPTPWLYDGRLRMVGVKLYLDGALGSRGAWLKAALSRRARPARPAAAQRHRAQESDEPRGDGHFQVAVHAIGDAGQCRAARAIEDMSDTYRATGAGGSSMPRSSTRPTCRAFAHNGIIASMQPVHQTATWRWPRRGWGRSGCRAPMPGAR